MDSTSEARTPQADRHRLAFMHLNAKGYEIEHNPAHALARNRKVAVHRRVLYDAIGPGETACHWCDKPLKWDLPTHHPSRVEVDHLDGDIRNNDRLNLVPVDRECNVRRQNAGNQTDWQADTPPTTCSVAGCERPREKQPRRGFCNLCAAHRWRLKHHGSVRADVPIRERRTASA